MVDASPFQVYTSVSNGLLMETYHTLDIFKCDACFFLAGYPGIQDESCHVMPCHAMSTRNPYDLGQPGIPGRVTAAMS